MKDDTIEKIMRDFLYMIKDDADNSNAEFLFNFISQIIEDVMDLGSRGYAPVLSFTMFARQRGLDTEWLLRGIRSDAHDVHESLKAGEFAQRVSDAWASYCKEVWGMTPLHEKDADVRGKKEEFNIQWGHLKK